MSLKESVPIELGGKRHLLCYDFNALVAISEELHISLDNIGNLLSREVSLGDLRAILWAGLIHEDEMLTPKAVGAMIDLKKDLKGLGAAVREAVELAFPPAEAVAGERKNGASRANRRKLGTSASS